MNESIVVVSGNVVRKRAISQRLLFLDITDGKHSTDHLIELICKYPRLDTDKIKSFRRTIGKGDLLECSGYVEKTEKGNCIHVVDIVNLSSSSTEVFGNTIDPKDRKQIFEVREFGNELHKVFSSKETLPSICKHWWQTKLCIEEEKGNCIYRHYFIDKNEEERYSFLRNKMQLQKSLAHDPSDTCEQKSSHHLRASIFVEWLISTFGREYLNSGTGILDIAGGNGSVSFEIHTKEKIKCTLIDPRPMKLGKLQHKYMKKNNIEKDMICEQYRTMFNDEFINQEQELVINSSIFIGMHPDQATEPIIDSALRIGKPFAVIPCCVFSRLNPQRTIKDEKGEDKKVVEYIDFIQYLKLKDNRIQETYLPFDGRNKVLYINFSN